MNPMNPHPMPVIQLVYASEAANNLTDLDVLDILQKAQDRNHTLKVSGLLLFDGRTFIQLLEGEVAIVENLYSVISQDPRHKHVELLGRFPVEAPAMPTWAMAYFSKTADASLVSRHHFFMTREHVTEICRCMPGQVGQLLQNGLDGVSPSRHSSIDR